MADWRRAGLGYTQSLHDRRVLRFELWLPERRPGNTAGAPSRIRCSLPAFLDADVETHAAAGLLPAIRACLRYIGRNCSNRRSPLDMSDSSDSTKPPQTRAGAHRARRVSAASQAKGTPSRLQGIRCFRHRTPHRMSGGFPVQIRAPRTGNRAVCRLPAVISWIHRPVELDGCGPHPFAALHPMAVILP